VGIVDFLPKPFIITEPAKIPAMVLIMKVDLVGGPALENPKEIKPDYPDGHLPDPPSYPSRQ